MKKNPYSDINVKKIKTSIKNKSGKVIFEKEVEFPDYFSDNAIQIVSSKYFNAEEGKEETKLFQMIDRVSDSITEWGKAENYFKTDEEREQFNYKLKRYQALQYFAFNSPVYFNAGLSDKPQLSACFILDIKDSMKSILDVQLLETKIFQNGSGTGYNLSKLRGSHESISSGGKASGPVSFLKAHDTAAGIIKSGGKTRRSAKLAALNVSHPDIQKFITCKEKEERKLNILLKNGFEVEAGYDLSDEVFFQNTNISVGITNDFMEAVENDGDWWTRNVKDKSRFKKYKAKDLLKQISKLAWKTADPGVLFLDTINSMHTCSKSGPIVSSNPCGEYLFLNDTSCNLASINMIKLFKQNEDGSYYFDIELYKDLVELIITAQDIIVDNGLYPSDEITKQTKRFRTLGLGYSNIGALLMLLGIPYDSDEGRSLVANLTALMTGLAYKQSAELAKNISPFKEFEKNKSVIKKVLKKHTDSVFDLVDEHAHRSHYFKQSELISSLVKWNEELYTELEQSVNDPEYKLRNAQVTVVAPTGTISFLMDCVTTGIEPEFALKKTKSLSGQSGEMEINNPIVYQSLINLGYSEEQLEEILLKLENDGHLENSINLKVDHKPIFHCSNTSGSELIDYMGHVKMVAEIQKFISGSISKTINLPSSATSADIYNLYLVAWRMGLKGITVYRDGSKTLQPLNTLNTDLENLYTNKKRKLPTDRSAITHEFNIGGNKGFLTCGLYEDASLGEIFIKISKQGSTLNGLLDCLAIIASMALQRQVPLKELVKNMMYQRFDPAGFTQNEEIRSASSIVDYVFRYLALRFLCDEDLNALGISKPNKELYSKTPSLKINSNHIMNNSFDNNSFEKLCENCGQSMTRTGTCFSCNHCGDNSGGCG